MGVEVTDDECRSEVIKVMSEEGAKAVMCDRGWVIDVDDL